MSDFLNGWPEDGEPEIEEPEKIALKAMADKALLLGCLSEAPIASVDMSTDDVLNFLNDYNEWINEAHQLLNGAGIEVYRSRVSIRTALSDLVREVERAGKQLSRSRLPLVIALSNARTALAGEVESTSLNC